MGEIFGVGATHVPYLMNAPENMLGMRKILCGFAEKLSGVPYQDAPEAIAQMGDDPTGVAREHHRLHWEAFAELRKYIDEVEPDAILMIGDDQNQCFQSNNMPPYAMFVGDSIDATPFHMSKMPGDDRYVKETWGADLSHTYQWPCHSRLSVAMRDGLIRRGFDIASTDDVNSNRWNYGLGHAHANTQLFFHNEDGRYPIVPLFINCYGQELSMFSKMSGDDDVPEPSAYPIAPSSARLYAMGESIREIIEESPYRVLICPSSTWSHSWLASRFDRQRLDIEGNREIVRWFEQGDTKRLREYDSPEIEANGDHEVRNWIVAAGIMGERKLKVTCCLESWVSTGFRVFGIWD